MLWCAAVLDDGLLDVSYVMNYPREQVPALLRELMRGREDSDTLEIMDCFGSMRVKWLEVHCADGLQVSFSNSYALKKSLHQLALLHDLVEILVHKGLMKSLLRLLVFQL